jgi:histone-lysine N-methyltransferase SETMAR
MMSVEKVIFVIFFTNQGPTIQIAVPEGKSVNAKFYKGKVFHKLKKYFKNRRPATGLRGVRLLHNNASSHKSAIVRDYLKQEKVFELPHPLYSPDLAPFDFYIFPRLKNTLQKENVKSEKISVRLFFRV